MKRDFFEYFTKVQKQQTEMDKVLEQVNKELEEGKCTWEQREQFEKYYMTVKANYDRLTYVKYLLQKPPKFIQKLQERKLAREQERFLKEMTKLNADEFSVAKENEESIEAMKDLLNEVTSEGKND